jgi:hypothetical protein
MTLSHTFTDTAAPGEASATLFLREGEKANYTAIGTIDAGCMATLQRRAGSGAWTDIKQWGAGSINASGRVSQDTAGNGEYRFLASVPTTDPVTTLASFACTMTTVVSVIQEWKNPAGQTVLSIQDDGVAILSSTPGTLAADTITEKTAAAGVTIDGVPLKDGGINLTGGSIQMPRGIASSSILQGFGATSAEGMQLACVEETFSFVGNVALYKESAYLFPVGAVLLCAQANVEAALTGGGTTVKVGLGTSSDPDVYGLSSALTKNTKITTMPAYSALTGTARVRVSSCATGGTAGDTALTVGSVRIRIIFLAPVNLADAP